MALDGAERQPDELGALTALVSEFVDRLKSIESEIDTLKQDQKELVEEYSDRLAANAAHVPEQYRLEMVKANSWVDEALLIDQPVTEVLERLRPEIV